MFSKTPRWRPRSRYPGLLPVFPRLFTSIPSTSALTFFAGRPPCMRPAMRCSSEHLLIRITSRSTCRLAFSPLPPTLSAALSARPASGWRNVGVCGAGVRPACPKSTAAGDVSLRALSRGAVVAVGGGQAHAPVLIPALSAAAVGLSTRTCRAGARSLVLNRRPVSLARPHLGLGFFNGRAALLLSVFRHEPRRELTHYTLTAALPQLRALR